uniref:Uncharacterized LOC100183570 n=1 Tax=Ciona intestinalis TaxID=7719 RepID=H2XYA6_CIOIN
MDRKLTLVLIVLLLQLYDTAHGWANRRRDPWDMISGRRRWNTKPENLELEDEPLEASRDQIMEEILSAE